MASTVTTTSQAGGIQAQLPEDVARPTLEVPQGATPARTHTIYVDSSALKNTRSTNLATTFYGSGWAFKWDSITGVPARITGEGRPFANVMTSARMAEDAAKKVLAEQLELLAPGSWLSDHELVANVINNGVRVVAFHQYHEGLRVVGGMTVFVFKADRLISIAGEAYPNVSLLTSNQPQPNVARRQATAWIDHDFNTTSHVTRLGEAVVLPIVTDAGVRFYRTLPVTVQSLSPSTIIGEWTVYVDANGVTARQSNLAFADGMLLYNTPEREPKGTRADFPAAQARVIVDGLGQTSTDDGVLTFNGASTSVDTSINGPFVSVSNSAGALATTNLTLNDASTVSWMGGDTDPLLDAQLTTFIHLNRSKRLARILSPGLPWLDQTMQATVNVAQACNAFSNGDQVTFFQTGDVNVNSTGETLRCANTGRLVDVIHHEFLHSFHHQSSIAVGGSGLSGDASQFQEGAADYWSATIQNDPGLGPGFFLDEPGPFRPMEGPKGERYLPQDLQTGFGIHFNGGLFAAAMWDLRVALIAKLGAEAGKAQADKLFHGVLQRATSMELTYTELLTEDDDDGNLANGTPNKCEIDFAFGTHGFGEFRSLLGEGLALPVQERYTISVATRTPTSGCAPMGVESMELYWQLRSDSNTNGTIAMELSNGVYSATIPKQAEGTVIQYQVTTVFAGGNSRRLPLNRVQAFYEFFNGATEDIYCTDFETDPFTGAQSWTTNGGFQAGTPLGSVTNSDADAAFSGSAVVGTGLAEPGSPTPPIGGGVSTLTSPPIDVSGKSNVRLQFHRWLNVDEALLGPSASISVNGTVRYNHEQLTAINTPAMQMDYQWRFVDIDLAEESSSGSVQVGFSLGGNQQLLGGWNIDDFCIVSFVPSVCGDGSATGNEDCDLGMANSDTEADACRTDCTAAACGDSVIDSGEACDDGNTADGDLCSADCMTDLSPETGGCGCQANASNSATTFGMILFVGLLLGTGRRRRRTRD